MPNNLYRKAIPLFILSTLVFILYGNMIGYDFISIDDGGQILENEKIHLLTPANIQSIFTSATVSMYQPLTSLLFAIIIALFGFKTATAFHLTSILLHILNSYLVYAIGKRLFSNKINAILLALLFALHPLGVEAVSWVSATSTLLFTTFFLSGMIQYDQYLQLGRKKNYLASILLFLLGCLSKVQMLPFVGVLFLLDFLRGNKIVNKERLVSKIPFVIIGLIFTWVSLEFRKEQSGFTGDYNPLFLVPSQITWYLFKAFIPSKLGIIYDWPHQLNSIWIFASTAILLVIGYVSYKRKGNKLFVFGLLFFLFNIILHTSLFTSFLGPYADRYGYLSLLGIWISVFSLFGQKQQKFVSLGGYVVLAVFFLIAKQQTTTWKDTITLWSNNLKHQTSTFSNGMRGQLYFEKNMYAAAQRDFELVDKNPDPRFEPEKYAYLYAALGLMTTDTQAEKSAHYFSLATEFQPTASNLENAGLGHEKINSDDQAEIFYLRCAEISTTSKCFKSLSSLYFKLNRFDDGAAIATQAIEKGYQELIFYKMRCFFRLQLNQLELAREDYQMAEKLFLEMQPHSPDLILQSLGEMLKEER